MVTRLQGVIQLALVVQLHVLVLVDPLHRHVLLLGLNGDLAGLRFAVTVLRGVLTLIVLILKDLVSRHGLVHGLMLLLKLLPLVLVGLLTRNDDRVR